EYAAREEGSLLARLLAAAGASLQDGDGALSRLLRSHWIDYAEGGGLDGLAGIFGVERRRLREGELEGDEAFRRRLKSVVRLYTGGGTVQALKGAVQAGSGLARDLRGLALHPARAGGRGPSVRRGRAPRAHGAGGRRGARGARRRRRLGPLLRPRRQLPADPAGDAASLEPVVVSRPRRAAGHERV